MSEIDVIYFNALTWGDMLSVLLADCITQNDVSSEILIYISGIENKILLVSDSVGLLSEMSTSTDVAQNE
jgi:hypothetical protein